jgi:hypothetical protein
MITKTVNDIYSPMMVIRIDMIDITYYIQIILYSDRYI